MENAGFIKALALFLAVFTICSAVPFSTAAADEKIDMPTLVVEKMDTLNVGTGKPGNLTYYNSDVEGDIPASYSSVEKGLITVPKDQGQNGTCWTFAAASMAETSILASGGTYGGKKANVDKINFSEAQIAYFTYSNSYDPLGNLNGDGTLYMGDDLLSCGGNHYFTTLAFAAWKGLCNDDVMPYDEFVENEDRNYDEALSYEAAVRLENSIWVNMADKNVIKSLIMTDGSVLTDYFHEDMFLNFDGYSYYCPDNYGTNHAITIVGWDDNYSSENFLETPAGDGAWLAKNSWGEDWGNEGYFWISYYDATIMNSDATCMQFVDAKKYDNNYQYDGSCSMSYVYLNSGMVVANEFTTSAYEEEKLEAVSFATMTPNVDYKIRILSSDGTGTYAGGGNFVEGEDLLEAPVEGHIDHAGYYTIPLNEEIIFDKGERYIVCITLYSETEPYISVMVDASGNDGSDIYFLNNTENDRSFYGMEGEWGDYTLFFSDLVFDNGVTARIKAFTTNVGEEDDDDDDDDFWEDLFDWFHTIINGIDTSHKVGEIIDLFADFYFDDNGYAHRFKRWDGDTDDLEIDEESAEISFVMPGHDLNIHAEYVIVGDVDSNETINAMDMIELSKTVKLDTDSDEFNLAADIDDNHKINGFDIVNMKRYMVGKYEITK